MVVGIPKRGLTSGCPPPPGGEPTDRAGHLGHREPATGPSIALACPVLWAQSQRDRLVELAGTNLVHVLMMLVFSEIRKACDSDYSMQWVGVQTCSLTAHRCSPTVATL